jgi:hypothetical protein
LNVPALPLRSTRFELLLAAAAGVWAAVLFAAFHPGLMSSDTVSQMAMGVSGDYFSNVHPPLMSWALGLVHRVAGSPWPALALQLAAIGGAGAALAAGATAPRRHAAAALLAIFLALPTTWAVGVIVWKDVWMAASLLWAIVALRAGRRLASVALVALAACLRHNAILAAIPLAAAAFPWSRARRLQSAALAAALVAAIAAAPWLVERALRVRDAWPGGQLLVYDLAAIYLSHPDDLAASTFSGDIEISDLARDYTPVHVVPLLFTDEPPGRRIPWSTIAPRRAIIVREWAREVVRHPRAYLAHRLEQFRFLLGIATEPVCYPFHRQIDPNPWGLHLDDTALHGALRRLADGAGHTILFRGWPWLALAAVAGAVALRRAREHPLAVATAASAVAYASAYLVVGVSCGFRFLYWTMIATFAVGFLLLGPGVTPAARARASTGAPDAATTR